MQQTQPRRVKQDKLRSVHAHKRRTAAGGGNKSVRQTSEAASAQE